MTEAEIIDGIIAREGGYVDHPNDRGAATNFGITLKTLRNWRRDPALTAADVQALSKEEARRIYRTEYIERPGFDRIANDHLRAHLIDFGVNSGPRTAALALQKILDVSQDGDIGPVTLAALRRMGAMKCSNLLMAARIMHYAKIVRGDPSQSAFIVGWLDRALRFMI